MRNSWSPWNVARLVFLLSFVVYALLYEEQVPLGNLSDLLMHGLTFALICGCIVALLVAVRNQYAAERGSKRLKSGSSRGVVGRQDPRISWEVQKLGSNADLRVPVTKRRPARQVLAGQERDGQVPSRRIAANQKPPSQEPPKHEPAGQKPGRQKRARNEPAVQEQDVFVWSSEDLRRHLG